MTPSEKGSGPLPALERAVLWLVPPLVREEVAGDLCERYRGPLPYLVDLIGTLPFLIWGQGRRGTEPALFVLVAATLFVSLGGLEPDRGLGGVPVPLRALAAALPALAVLWLRNAYRRDESWNGLRAMGDAAWLGIALAASQLALALFAPAYGHTIGWLFGGFVFTAIVMVMLRSGLELANTGLRPGTAAPLDPVADFQAFRRNLRLRAGIETAALAPLVGVAAWFSLTADRPFVSLAAGLWATASLLLIAHRWQRHPRGLATSGAKDPLAPYLAELRRQRAARGLAWWWYFAPLFLGIGFQAVAFGLATGRPVATAAGVAAAAVLAAMLLRLGARRRARLREKIAQLERCAGALPA